jgi:hypothetical protein
MLWLLMSKVMTILLDMSCQNLKVTVTVANIYDCQHTHTYQNLTCCKLIRSYFILDGKACGYACHDRNRQGENICTGFD